VCDLLLQSAENPFATRRGSRFARRDVDRVRCAALPEHGAAFDPRQSAWRAHQCSLTCYSISSEPLLAERLGRAKQLLETDVLPVGRVATGCRLARRTCCATTSVPRDLSVASA
jgi:hypothetical protein